MTSKTEPTHIEPRKLFEVISRYAGRVAQTDDPKAHQRAAQDMQVELQKAKGK